MWFISSIHFHFLIPTFGAYTLKNKIRSYVNLAPPWIICTDVDGPRDCHTECHTERKTNIEHECIMWDLEKWYRWSYLQSTNREQTCGHQEGERQWEEQEDWSWPLHTIDTVYKPDNQGKHTVQHMELYCMHCADPNEEFQKEAEIYMCRAHSFHWTAETLESS